MMKKGELLELIALIAVTSIPLFALILLNEDIQIKVPILIFVGLYVVLMVLIARGEEGEGEYRFKINPFRAFLLFLFTDVLSATNSVLQLDVSTILHLPAAIGTLVVITALPLPILGKREGGLSELLRVYLAGMGVITLISYLLFLAKLQVLFTPVVLGLLVLGSLLNRGSLTVSIPKDRRFIAFLSILLVFAVLSSLNLFNPYTDQISFVARALWKDREPLEANHTFGAPLGAYLPEYTGMKLFFLHPWPLDLFLFPLLNLLFFTGMADILRERGGVGYIWLLSGDLVMSLLLVKGSWNVGSYTDLSWKLTSGLILPRWTLLKDVLVIIGMVALSEAPPVMVLLALPFLFMTQTIVAASLLPLLSLDKKRWRYAAIGSLIATILIAVEPKIFLVDFGLHMKEAGLPVWAVVAGPLIAYLIIEVTRPFWTDIFGRIPKWEVFIIALISLLTISLMTPVQINPVEAPAHPEWGLGERSLSSIQPALSNLLPWALALLFLPVYPRELETLFLIVMALWMALPVLFYEPLRLSAFIPFPFILALSTAKLMGWRKWAALLLLSLSLPLGYIAFTAGDNLRFVRRFDKLASVPAGATVVDYEYRQYAAVKGIDYTWKYLVNDLEHAVLMSPDPALVQSQIPGHVLYSPDRIKYDKFSFISNSNGTLLRGASVELPKKITFEWLHSIWRYGPSSYVTDWGTCAPPENISSFTQVVIGSNVTIRYDDFTVRVGELAIYPSFCYAYAVAKDMKGYWPSYNYDPVTVAPFIPYGYVSHNPRETGIPAYPTMFRPYNFSIESPLLSAIQLVHRNESRWFIPNNASFWDEGLYEVHYHFSNGSVYNDLYSYVLFMKKGGAKIIILPPGTTVEGNLTGMPLCPGGGIAAYTCDIRKFRAMEIEYGAGNVLLVRGVKI